MIKQSLLFTFLVLVACHQVSEQNALDIFTGDRESFWITDQGLLPASDSLYYLDHPAPIFRKEFKISNAVKKADLYITAAGYYHASINGMRVGKNVLDPAWTDYSKRIYFTIYDVTELLQDGDNCIGVHLGNGFYNPLPLRKWGRRNLRVDTKVGKPAFLSKLVLQYADGKTESIVSDDSWRYAYGPFIRNSVYLGVWYDARRELPEWDVPGFDDSAWQHAKVNDGPGGRLEPSFFPSVQINEEITPVSISSADKGKWMVDMGVNFTGSYKIKLTGIPGDTIHFRFGERLYEDGTLNPMTSVIGQIKRKGVGGPGAPDIAWQTDRYIVGAREPKWFSPDFTYHAYRYMEITGLDAKPDIDDIRGLFIHSNMDTNGAFSCSSPLLNTIQDAVVRTFRSNLVSVQSDCPAREKFGYGGDINATSESFIYNLDMNAFYRKTLYDWLDAMNDTSFVDTAPFVGIRYCGISWESAYLITQYYLYLYYGDTALVHEYYDMNNQWMEKAARIHPDGLVKEGLSDHESLEPVPVELTGTCHYLQCARIMQTFASVMGDDANEEQYDKLANRLKNLIKSKFWDQPVTDKINRQTLFSTLLYHGIVPEEQVAAATDSLLNALKNGPSGHFNTGIFGTKYIMETLSEYASPQIVYDVVNSTEYPGWGHMIDRGATTIWETWKESDDTYSNNHPMFGTVTEWYYRWLGGIRPDLENPGFSRFILSPSTPDGIDFVQCSYHSPFGKIVSNWNRDSSGIIRYQMSVPEGSVASVALPSGSYAKLEVLEKDSLSILDGIEGLSTGQFELTPGDYVVMAYP